MTSHPNGEANGNTEDPSHDDEVDPGWPWSFLLLVGAGAIYLVLRLVEAINDFILN